MRSCALLFTCEHASAEVPERYRHLFSGTPGVLRTHRAVDLGALPVARVMADEFAAPLLAGRVTRLLIDLNRSPRHMHVFSEFSASLTAEERSDLLRTYHAPHTSAVEAAMDAQLTEHPWVLHIAVHSFTPVLHGQVRAADIGLLYDPRRPRERLLCQQWQAGLRPAGFDLPIRRNYPYRGVADGLPTRLRRSYPDARYAGVELEINQRLLTDKGSAAKVAAALIAALQGALANART